MNVKLTVRYILGGISSLAGMGVALFWSVGRMDWWPAWGALAVMLAWMTGMGIVNLRLNPNLLDERLGPRQGAKSWDTAIVSVIGLVQLVRYIIAGLDQRYGWTGSFPVTAQITALVICFLGYTLFVWATASNTFFTKYVRIQPERGHTVADSGPYRYVRHPAYIGGILYELAVPILLASCWALLVSGLCVILLILRTALEDRTLQLELAGYADYSQKVRFRLLPGIW
jgi:protein-S-isoprenylcysteine O-methyltransferase Ste14